jgi:hypothetical protein
MIVTSSNVKVALRELQSPRTFLSYVDREHWDSVDHKVQEIT